MADIKLTQLPESSDVENDDLVMVVTDTDTTPVSKKAKKSTLMAGLASSSDLSAHESRTDNPHQVTKTQVGLGNVPNLDTRPRSTHTGTQPMNTISGLSDALDGKAATNHTQTAATITDLDDAIEANEDVAANSAARHTHANKALLDTYTQTEADIADAIAKEHTHANKGVLDATTASFTTADEAKLDGIATGATANDSDANLKNRANHTGTQAISTINGLQGALDGKASTTHNHDSRYYREEEVDDLLDTKANASDIPATIVESVVAGDNVTIDNTDPANPVVSASAGGAGEWGEITGTLSNQTDLQNALNTKADDTSLIDALPATVGTNGQVLKSNGSTVTWQTDANTTYTEITEAEITTGTASNARTISGRRAQAIVDKAQTTVPTPTNDTDAANKKYVDDELAAFEPGDSLPDQTGNAGRFLTTDGTDPAWASLPGGGDMAAATYDPTSKQADAFNMENMEEGTTKKILTASERADIASAVQLGDLATVATTGSYDDLTNKPTIPDAQVPADWEATSGVSRILNKPTLGTAAAADTDDFATATQGAKADTAVQPAAIANFETTTQLNARDTDNRNRANHTGAQPISSVTNLQSTLDSKADSASLADVATSGDYDDLANKPEIPSTFLEDVVAGTNVTIDKTDPKNPVISASGGGGGGGVSSIAKDGEAQLTGDVTLSAGSNVTLTQSGQNIEIAASGGGGGGGESPDYSKVAEHHLSGDANNPAFSMFAGTTASQGSGGLTISIPAAENARFATSSGVPYIANRIGFWNRKVMGRVFFRRISANGYNHHVHMCFGYAAHTVIQSFATIKSIGFHKHRTESSLFAYSSDGTATTRTDLSGIVGMNNSSEDLVAIHTPATNVKYYRNGSLIATHTTNIPSGDTLDSSYCGFFTGKEGDYPGAATSTIIGDIYLREELN